MTVISDPFFRQMFQKLAEEIDRRSESLSTGSALINAKGIGVDVYSTAMKYQASVSYIEALKFVIELGLEMDLERYGKHTGDE
jgi:hypothetical protein